MFDLIAYILFIVAFALFGATVFRIVYQREACDVYELMGAMIIAVMSVFGIVEWVWMSWVFFLLGQTFWFPNVFTYYFGVFTVMLLIMVVTGIALCYYVKDSIICFDSKYFAKGFLVITSSALLGWFMEDRIAGALTTWTVPQSWLMYWSSWLWLWAPYLAFMIPYWALTLIYVYVLK